MLATRWLILKPDPGARLIIRPLKVRGADMITTLLLIESEQPWSRIVTTIPRQTPIDIRPAVANQRSRAGNINVCFYSYKENCRSSPAWRPACSTMATTKVSGKCVIQDKTGKGGGLQICLSAGLTFDLYLWDLVLEELLHTATTNGRSML